MITGMDDDVRVKGKMECREQNYSRTPTLNIFLEI
jgi:hypothetical protein